MPAQIEDVARKANVSISTVSRVVNGRAGVNAETRKRVELAIKELSYRPNAFARGLMLRRSEIVGLVLPDLHGEFYSEIIRGANLQARDMGYALVVSSAKDPGDTHSLLQGMHQRTMLDGVAVMVSEITGGTRGLLTDFPIPLVVLDGDVNGAAHDSVVIDQREGVLALMRHVVNVCGARRVFFVGGLKTNVDTLARLDACRQALSELNLELSDGDVYHLDYDYDTAHALARLHVRDWAGAGHCVFAANDEMAWGILDAAGDQGVNVPGQLAVVGFDDTRIARLTRPPLTTVHVPMFKMGAAAVRLLCERLADPLRAPVRVSLHPELVVRESCGARKK